MDRQPVVSSNIKSIGHCGRSETLEIEYLDGGVYQYDQVTAGIHQELMQARSKGQYMHAHIKGRFSYRKVG